MQLLVFVTFSFIFAINAQFSRNHLNYSCYLPSGPAYCVSKNLCKDELIHDNKLSVCESSNVCCDPNKLIATNQNSLKSTSQIPVSESPWPQNEKCGVRNINGISPAIKDVAKNKAKFGEFPWMVALLREENIFFAGITLHAYVCGGSLIHPRVVLTAAHCISKGNIFSRMKIRAGEYDTQKRSEPLPHQDIYVLEVAIHEHFNQEKKVNDIALLFLEKPVRFTGNVGVVCLPPQSNIIKPANCTATGWGKNRYGRKKRYQRVLKRIDLPIVENAKCEMELKKNTLSHYFELDHTFMCAGGINDEGPCTGDEGSPLVCPMTYYPDRYEQIGIVLWSVKCTPPGVYVNVPRFRNWIDEQLIVREILDLNFYQLD